MTNNGLETKLQNNECLVLKYLVENARASDSYIAEKIGISTQAVGKIRRKLEEQRVILGYNVQLNQHSVGLELFTYVGLWVPPELIDDPQFRKRFVNDPHLSASIRLLHGSSNLLCIFVFSTLETSQTYFLNFLKKYPGIRITNLQDSTWHLVWKLNQNDVFKHALDCDVCKNNQK